MIDKDIKLKQKIAHFKEAFPLAYQDTELDVDLKHKKIIKETGNKKDWMGSLSYKNLRNWSMQSDMDAPVTIGTILENTFLNTPYALRAVYSLVFKRSQVRKLREVAEDDISIIKEVGAMDLLKANPVHLTPGQTPYIVEHGTSYNTRWLRYVYLASQIRKYKLLESGDSWVDIGSFYGGIQSIVKKWNNETSIVLVDFHHQLLRSYIFLHDLFPESTHNLGIQGDVNLIKPGTISYIPVSEYSQLNSFRPSLLTNFFSFGEMHRKDYLAYIQSSAFANARFKYLVNRFVSSPFFEPIYDSDLTIWDYLLASHTNIYFDIFPIHNYHSIKRELFGVTRYRNAGSQYFEFIQMKNN